MSKVRVCDLCGRIIDIDRKKYKIKGIRDCYSFDYCYGISH